MNRMDATKPEKEASESKKSNGSGSHWHNKAHIFDWDDHKQVS
jgi:hypothetical protein